MPQFAAVGAFTYLLLLEEEANCLRNKIRRRKNKTFVPTRDQLLESIINLNDCTHASRLITTQPKPQDDNCLYTELKNRINERQVAQELADTSGMRYLALMEYYNICRGTSGLYEMASRNSPMSKLTQDAYFWSKSMAMYEYYANEPLPYTKNDIVNKINSLKHLVVTPIDVLETCSYNCNSPLMELNSDHTFISALNKRFFAFKYRHYINANDKKYMKVSPMYQLASCSFFKNYLKNCQTYYRSRNAYNKYKTLFIHPFLQDQYNIVMSSKYRKLLNDSLLIPKLIHYVHKERIQEQDSSPMRKYISESGDTLMNLSNNHYFSRNVRKYTMMVSPMRYIALKRKGQIRALSTLKTQRLRSPIRKYSICNRRALTNACNIRSKKLYLRNTSQMSKFSLTNSDLISEKAIELTNRPEIYYRYSKQIGNLKNVTKELKDSYQSWKQRLDTVRFCLDNNIPIVELLPGHMTRILVSFPASTQAAQFLSTSNLDDFSIVTTCKGKDIKVEECCSLFPRNVTQNSIINAAQSLKNMTNIIMGEDERATVKVLTEANTMGVNPISLDTSSPYRVATVKLMRRDQGQFNESTYKKCLDVMKRYMKKNKVAMKFESGFIDAWMSNELKITLSVPMKEIELKKFKQMVSDIILNFNMIKDVIFASLNVETCWLSI